MVVKMADQRSTDALSRSNAADGSVEKRQCTLQMLRSEERVAAMADPELHVETKFGVGAVKARAPG